MALVNALPAEGQPLALRALVNGWIAIDATAALAWAERIDDSPSRDACLSAVVGSAALENPEWAMKVVEKIGDTAQRDQATTTVINSVTWSQASNTGVSDGIKACRRPEARRERVGGTSSPLPVGGGPV